jgi:hypothetical protein
MASIDLVGANAWRPQPFGRRNVRDIDDPVIEPLWTGIRVLAHVGRGARFVDADGGDQPQPEIEAALVAALGADAAVLDGYLTHDAVRSGEGVLAADGPTPASGSQVVRQLFVGGGRSDAREARDDAISRRLAQRGAGSSPARVAFVAVDLLALDGEPLLDVPLLERKRLLDGILEQSDLVRVGVHVRPPVDIWLRTWRALGFRELAYKAANSRYSPGARNDGWASIAIPPG